MNDKLKLIIKVIYFSTLVIITLLLDYFYNNLFLDILFIIFSLLLPISMYVDKTENKILRKIFLPISGQYIFLYIFLLYSLPLSFFIKKYYRININYIWVIYLLLILKSYYNYKKYKIKKYKIYSKKIKEKIKIVYFSDLHLNEFTKNKDIKLLISKINDFEPDYIINGGDILDSYVSLVTENIKEELKKANAKTKIIGIMGNHELYGKIDENKEYIKELGIELLEDEIYEDEKLIAIGRKMKNESRKELKSLKKETEKFTIVLDHVPSWINESVENNIDLHISGHTHAGQFFPVNILYRLIFPMIYGCKKIKNTVIIVSSGLGVSFVPYRNQNRAEIIYLELNSCK